MKVFYLSDILDKEGMIAENYFYAREPKNTPIQFLTQAQPSDKAIADWRAAIRATFVYGNQGINRMMILKEATSTHITTNDPLQKIIHSLSSDKKNVISNEAVKLTNDDCKPIKTTMQSEGELQIFGHGSVKDG